MFHQIRDYKYAERFIVLAKKKFLEVPFEHIAFTVCKSRIISIGKNSYVKSHPIQAFYAKQAAQPERCFLHAEIDAIIKAGKRIVYCDSIVSFRMSNSGALVCAAPCLTCKAAIDNFKLKVYCS